MKWRASEMSFVIAARFLMGLYQGRDSSGEPERYPTPDRLFKALLSVACLNYGYTSEGCHESEQISETLRWLESNPPDKIRLPSAILSDGYGVVAYRDKGFTEKHKVKMASSPAVSAYRYQIDDALEWIWLNPPSERIAECLENLCEEIPYLGESCSKVHVIAQVRGDDADTPDQRSRTYVKDDVMDLEALNSHIFINCPTQGRLEELCANHNKLNSRKVSNRKIDEKKVQETNLLAEIPEGRSVIAVAYRGEGLDTRDSARMVQPWDRAILLPVRVASPHAEWQPLQLQTVRWAVAMHRFLIRKWGFGAPAVLTGKYMKIPGIPQPANNVAIHVLSDSLGKEFSSKLQSTIRQQLPAFLILIPREMSTEDFAGLCDVCQRSQGDSLYCGHDLETLEFGEPRIFDDSTIWQEPANDRVRYWKPLPFAMAETRAFTDPQGRRKWRARETIALSIAHVWRDLFDASYPERTGHQAKEQGYWDAADAVLNDSSPVQIVGAKPAFRTHMEDYAHHVQESNVLRGCNALIRFSEDCANECCAMAIGQTRHLGGGLLVPVDIPNDLIAHDPVTGKEEPIWLS